MKKFSDFIFSMAFGGMMLLLIAAVTGTATFIENDYGTTAAKIMVYDALWFELLLVIAAISLIGSIFKYKLIQTKKWATLTFHVAFVIMLLGAGITRYIGTEGSMRIREGESSDQIISSETYVQMHIQDGENDYYFDKPYLFSVFKQNKLDKTVTFGDQEARIKFLEYIPNAAQTIEPAPEGEPIISLVTVDASGRRNVILETGDRYESGPLLLSFQAKTTESEDNAIQLIYADKEFRFLAPFDVMEVSMADQTNDTLAKNEYHTLEAMKLYNMNGQQVVFRNLIPSGRTRLVSAASEGDNQYAPAVRFELRYNEKREELAVYGGSGILGETAEVEIDGVLFKLKYGAKLMTIPFALHLTDFQLTRYPGSHSPSSFASEVIVIDPEKPEPMPYRIFMNNVLNYKGFRFFQSSYDKDERGTILSVNQDKWGTMVSYFGYFLMTVGLLFSFLSKKSRFSLLARQSGKSEGQTKSKGQAGVALLIALMVSLPVFTLQAQHNGHGDMAEKSVIDAAHAAKFGELLVQGKDGRIKPINTLASEILRKVHRKNTYQGMNADQVFLGMLTNPLLWQSNPFIKVSNDELKSLLGISGKYASFNDFLEMTTGAYKLSGYVDQAYSKNPAEKNKFDKDIIKVDERVNIVFMVYKGEFLTIFPKPGDPNFKWYSAAQAYQEFDTVDAGFVDNVLDLYFSAINESVVSGNWDKPDEYLDYIRTFQDKFGTQVLPEGSKTKLEILYNKINIFKRLFPVYALAGFILLILLFTSLLSNRSNFKILSKVIIIFIGMAFLAHTLGLAARWYIAGHAPWSNGYETMIYISWGIVLSGFIFSRKSKITLATTAILASLTLMVANLSWLDPEITNLVPVLKSYWLVIHVAVITASYSFLAIGALLGFLNLLLINFQTSRNYKTLNETIKELTNITEMNLIIGVFLITIGTFLGAVWANESWGRYWSWDPKETWALISVLVYSFVVHMRMIPGLKGLYAFNFASLISFSAILMTYFGVNYYLSGMHSYAQGDPVPVPTFVYYTIAVIAIVSIMAYINHRKMQKAGLDKVQ